MTGISERLADSRLSIIQDRNLTSHEYDEEESIAICDRIIAVYVEEFGKLADKIKDMI